MRTDVIFRDIKLFDHLKDFVERLTEDTVAEFQRSNDLHAVVVVGKSAPRTDTHGPLFKCTVLVRGAAFPAAIFVKKENRDFYAVVRDSLTAVKRKMRKFTHRRIPARRRPAVVPEALSSESEVFY